MWEGDGGVAGVWQSYLSPWRVASCRQTTQCGRRQTNGHRLRLRRRRRLRLSFGSKSDNQHATWALSFPVACVLLGRRQGRRRWVSMIMMSGDMYLKGANRLLNKASRQRLNCGAAADWGKCFHRSPEAGEEGEVGAAAGGAEGLRVVAWQPSKDMRRSLAQRQTNGD